MHKNLETISNMIKIGMPENAINRKMPRFSHDFKDLKKIEGVETGNTKHITRCKIIFRNSELQ